MGIYSSSLSKKMHCMKCKKKTDTKNYLEEISKNGKRMGKGN